MAFVTGAFLMLVTAFF